MSSDNIPAKTASYDNNQTTGDHKTAPLKPPEQPLKCPRCDSQNTKFCYYNNYSLTQPRHFCKTCRRYWTKGGALRNVSCRKNNKTESASRLSGESSSETGGGLNFFHGLAPAFEFQLIHNHFASFGDVSSTATTTTTAVAEVSGSLFGFNYPVASVLRQGDNGGFNGETQVLGSLNINSTLASSIKSLSSMNHDLHWKLQQQRLAMLIDGENQKESCSVSSVPATTLLENQAQKVQPISFQNLKIPNQEVCAVTDNHPRKSGNAATELFFGNSYNPTNNSSSSNAKDNTSNGSEIQVWPDLHQYSALP